LSDPVHPVLEEFDEMVRPLRLMVVLAAVALGTTALLPTAASASVPTAMAAFGDSISVGFDANAPGCKVLNPCPAESWSTGTDPAVNSHAARFAARGPLTAQNFAKAGQKIAYLSSAEIPAAVAQNVGYGYLTVLMGANDICTATRNKTTGYWSFTSAASFASSASAALNTLRADFPNALIAVGSIPNLFALWQNNYSNPNAVAAWAQYHPCDSMLTNPAALSGQDMGNRRVAAGLIVQYNQALQSACAAISGCAFDDDALYDNPIGAADLSTIDWFHPSVSGQATLSQLLWQNATVKLDPSFA
jgi:lysophospholipase L1-like esterase